MDGDAGTARYPHVAAALDYAWQVVNGDIVACQWVIKACRRQIDDLDRWQDGDPDWPWVFDAERAERVCQFVTRLCHIKGKWARRRPGRQAPTITLEAWQSFIVTTVFGWVHRDTGLRRFRSVYEEVARKNAKSTKLSGIGLYMATADGEPGAECYSVATKREQAKIVFGDARLMALADRGFRRRFGLEVMANSLSVPGTASVFRPLDAEGKTQDGLNVHFAAVDEFHAHRTRTMWDVIETATGAREQPLLWAITTAGSDRAGICYEHRIYATKVLDGVLTDETLFAVIYTIDDGDDWKDERCWAKANPNLGVSVNVEQLRALRDKAIGNPSSRNTFLTKHLNVWVNAGTPSFDIEAWRDCSLEGLEPEGGQAVTVALDLASKIDLAAKVVLFDRPGGKVGVKATFYLPQAAIDEATQAAYPGWAADGWITVTPGNVTDFDRIRDDLVGEAGEDGKRQGGDLQRYDLTEVGYDPWQATQLALQLKAEGAEVVEYRNTVGNMSEPMKTLQAWIREGRIEHDGNPVLEWCISNVTSQIDAKDNIYPRKERPENKIDGAVALIMAIGMRIAREIEGDSVYENHDLMVL